MLEKTEWWRELSTQSHNMNVTDSSVTSSHYYYRERIGTTEENLNLDIMV